MQRQTVSNVSGGATRTGLEQGASRKTDMAAVLPTLLPPTFLPAVVGSEVVGDASSERSCMAVAAPRPSSPSRRGRSAVSGRGRAGEAYEEINTEMQGGASRSSQRECDVHASRGRAHFPPLPFSVFRSDQGGHRAPPPSTLHLRSKGPMCARQGSSYSRGSPSSSVLACELFPAQWRAEAVGSADS